MLHPKVKAAGIAGLLVAVALAVVDALGGTLPPEVSALITAALSGVAGYLQPSTPA